MVNSMYIMNKTDVSPALSEARGSRVITATMILLMIVSAALGITSAAVSAANQAERVVDTETADVAETSDTPVSRLPDIESNDEPITDSPDAPETIDEPETPDEPPPPEKYIMEFPHLTQQDKLVTGCEIVSSSMVLSYYGKTNITLDQIYKNMKRGDVHVDKNGRLYGMSPSAAFIGSPHELSGLGCFPPVVKEMIDNFRFDDLKAEVTTGTALDELSRKYTANDIPVLVWVTEGMCETYPGDKWYIMEETGEITKEAFVWPLNEHCVVLVGYDKNNYYFSDPLDERKCVKYSRKLSEKRYNELGRMSVVVEQTRKE